MTWYQFLDAHPLVSGAILVYIPMALDWLLHVIAATVAATLHGPYRGQTVTTLDRAGFFVTALVLMCAPVLIIGVL